MFSQILKSCKQNSSKNLKRTLQKKLFKIEKQSNISINVFGYENKTPYCIFNSKQTFKKHVVLLLLPNTKNFHYVLISHFKRFMTDLQIDLCKYAVRKLAYLLRYGSDQYKTQQMCNKATSENGGTLNSAPDSYKNQAMSNNVVDRYLHLLKFFSEYFMPQKMCDKAVNTYLSTIGFVPQCFMTQEMCNKAVTRCFWYY